MRPAPRRSSIPERIVRSYAAIAVSRVAYGLLLIALIPVMTVLGLLCFVLVGVVWFGLVTLLGEPGPPLGAILGVGWFGGSLLLLFLILRRGHRWLTRLIHIADVPAAWIDPGFDDAAVAVRAPAVTDESADAAYLERVAAADAHLASPPVVPDGPPAAIDVESGDDPREEP